MQPDKPFEDIFQAIEYLRINNTGTDQIIANIKNFILWEDEEEQEFVTQVLTKSLTFGVSGSTANKVYGNDFVPDFKVMLAEKYFENPDYVIDKEFTLTMKLDGFRCLAVKKSGVITLYSREGQIYEGLIDIENDLNNLRLDNFVLDGELLITNTQGLSSKEQYKATSKIVRKDGEKHGITFRVFDVLTSAEFDAQQSALPYHERRYNLEKFFSSMEYIEILPVLYSGNDIKQIDKWVEKAIADKQEGIMLNINDAVYEFKRTKNILKCKVMHDCDLKIIGFAEGKGNLAGTLGNINVDYKGNTLGVGSGFTKPDRAYFWSHQEELLGRVVTVQYFEETQDKDGKLSLRFPVFKELRDINKTVNY